MNTLQKLVREVEKYGDDKITPACACGCGDPVPITNKHGGPSKFVNHAHSTWVHPGGDFTAANAVKNKDRIPIEDFRAAVRKIKAAKGLSNPRLAEQAGIQLGQLSDLMYGKKRVTVERKTAEQMLRRLAGMSAQPSTWQKRHLDTMRARDERAIRETDPDGIPRTRLH